MLVLTSWVSITPLFLIYLLLMDWIFMFNTSLLDPINFLLGCCGVFFFRSCADSMYESFFQMNRTEVSGVRRMRTITQLLFESLIQFIIQGHMLSYFNRFPAENDAFSDDIGPLLISILMSAAHAILEFV